MKEREQREFWNSLLTEQSWQFLQELRRAYEFVLIGGWAVYLHTRQQKSKDIDIVVSLKELEKLKQAGIVKNDRLKKYELQKGEVDVDIYVEHYSELGIPAEDIRKHAIEIEGLSVVRAEALLVLKQVSHAAREFSAKGEKDALDILSLLFYGKINFRNYETLLKKYGIEQYLEDLKKIVKGFTRSELIGLNALGFKRKKEEVLRRIG